MNYDHAMWLDDSAQDVAEHAFLTAVVAGLALGAVSLFGDKWLPCSMF
jgi:hypothetical protein